MRTIRLLIAGALVAAPALGLAGVATAGGDGGDRSQLVRMQDDCDPTTFNQAVEPGTCVGDGDTTFEEFIEELVEEGEAHKWRNKPVENHIELGERIHLVNQGGEFHTFTKVRSFRGGCVPELNQILGLKGRSPAFCIAAFSDRNTALPPDAESTIRTGRLRTGHEYKFQCMVHPWMQTTVEVRAD
jgi:hypothetical protein